MGKNCASGRTQDQGHSFFFHTDRPRPVNNIYLFFSSSKLVLQINNGLVYATLVIECLESAFALSINDL